MCFGCLAGGFFCLLLWWVFFSFHPLVIIDNVLSPTKKWASLLLKMGVGYRRPTDHKVSFHPYLCLL